jgi:hypothetical protein
VVLLAVAQQAPLPQQVVVVQVVIDAALLEKALVEVRAQNLH